MRATRRNPHVAGRIESTRHVRSFRGYDSAGRLLMLVTWTPYTIPYTIEEQTYRNSHPNPRWNEAASIMTPNCAANGCCR